MQYYVYSNFSYEYSILQYVRNISYDYSYLFNILTFTDPSNNEEISYSRMEIFALVKNELNENRNKIYDIIEAEVSKKLPFFRHFAAAILFF